IIECSAKIHPNIWSFIKLIRGEKTHFHHIYTQFSLGLSVRAEQAKTIAIQHRVGYLGDRYYDDLITAIETLCNFFLKSKDRPFISRKNCLNNTTKSLWNEMIKINK